MRRELWVVLLLLMTMPAAVRAQTGWVEPGAVWRDTAGNVIQAHGGGVLKVGAEWWWFGEDRTVPTAANGLDAAKRYVSCYRSRDLVRWEFCGRPLGLAEPEDMRAKFGGDWILERPKVFAVHATKGAKASYVMYFHADAAYKAAEVGVAVADRPEGPYRFVKHFRPLGEESRDIGQFVDDDGTNYLIFESRPTKGFFIARLTADGMGVVKTAFVEAPLEGGAMVRVGGVLYVIGSHMTGWAPNPNVYATATKVEGPWSAFKDLASPERKMYGAQSSMLVKVEGSKGAAVVWVGDEWRPKDLPDSRYVWVPAEVGNGVMRVPEPGTWRVDVGTGEVAWRWHRE